MSTNFALTACPCAEIFRVNGDISLKSAKLTYLSTFLTSNGNTSETCGAPLYQWPDATNDAPTTKRGFRRPAAPRRHTLHARSPAFSDPAPTHMPRAQRTEGSHGGRPRGGAYTPPAQQVARGGTHPHTASRWTITTPTPADTQGTSSYSESMDINDGIRPMHAVSPLIPPRATRRPDSLIALIR